MEEARTELSRILHDRELENLKPLLLVFANKQDLPGSMSSNLPFSLVTSESSRLMHPEMTPAEIVQVLGLQQDNPSVEPLCSWQNELVWNIEPTVGTSGQGIFEGLKWLSDHIRAPQV